MGVQRPFWIGQQLWAAQMLQLRIDAGDLVRMTFGGIHPGRSSAVSLWWSQNAGNPPSRQVVRFSSSLTSLGPRAGGSTADPQWGPMSSVLQTRVSRRP